MYWVERHLGRKVEWERGKKCWRFEGLVQALNIKHKTLHPKQVAGKSFTHVFDNFAKDVATCSLAETAKNEWGVKSFVYVSSAGMYKGDVPQLMKEDGAVKATGQKAVEEVIVGAWGLGFGEGWHCHGDGAEVCRRGDCSIVGFWGLGGQGGQR